MFDSIALFTSPTEWMVVGVIVLLLFGGSKIPEMMRGLGSGVKEFKKGIKEDDEPETKAEKKVQETVVKE